MKHSLLVELFTEELPPKVLNTLGESFAGSIFEELVTAGFVARTVVAKAFATPRRLAVLIPSVQAQSDARSESRKMMPAKVGFDAAGKPSAALLKRLEKEGVSADSATLERKTEGDAEYVFLHMLKPGVALAEALQAALDKALSRLPIPKLMSYQLADGATTVQFVRPAHGLVAMHGVEVVPVSALGLRAGNITHGHRFQGTRDIAVPAADAYEETLAAHGKVIASFSERMTTIERGLRDTAASLGSSLGREEDVAPLLNEVTALVERPAIYAGQFDPEFLAVPQECLILTMRANQKYFPLFDANGRLTHRFLIVSNMQVEDPQHIIEGNQRVVRPRLADARFFFETDKKTKLADRIEQLGTVVYHNKLGSQLERIARVRKLATSIAALTGADTVLADRAALLAKGDLVTNMVGEFPELQGIMGRYYALADGEDAPVAAAIEEHYRPRFAGDALPTNDIGVALALADKLETLAGMFGIGQLPTGDKDPFALRRHALGVLRILIEKRLGVKLGDLIGAAFGALAGSGARPMPAELEEFFYDRLRGYLRDLGYSTNEVEAVLSLKPEPISALPARLEAVRDFAALPEAASLAAANKRTRNILGKAQFAAGAADPALFAEAAETALYAAVTALRGRVGAATASGDFKQSLTLLATLRPQVDRFFTDVMVNAEDARVRENRLRLLSELSALLNQVADISKLAV
jgi:glycyl-tRNA synthetase beta chain